MVNNLPDMRVDSEEQDLEPCDVFVDLGMLVVEGRTPGVTGRGYGEGPHCPPASGSAAAVRHRCDSQNPQCIREEHFRKHMMLLWRNSIPMSIEVLLCPDCCQSDTWVTPNGVESLSATEPSHILLEQWTIQMLPKRIPDVSMSGKNLIHALRSYLHFSQLSAWYSLSGGKSPRNVMYRICVPGEAFSNKFTQTPDIHSFPMANVSRTNAMKVTVRAMPRCSSVPRVHCPVHELTQSSQGNNCSEPASSEASKSESACAPLSSKLCEGYGNPSPSSKPSSFTLSSTQDCLKDLSITPQHTKNQAVASISASSSPSSSSSQSEQHLSRKPIAESRLDPLLGDCLLDPPQGLHMYPKRYQSPSRCGSPIMEAPEHLMFGSSSCRGELRESRSHHHHHHPHSPLGLHGGGYDCPRSSPACTANPNLFSGDRSRHPSYNHSHNPNNHHFNHPRRQVVEKNFEKSNDKQHTEEMKFSPLVEPSRKLISDNSLDCQPVPSSSKLKPTTSTVLSKESNNTNTGSFYFALTPRETEEILNVLRQRTTHVPTRNYNKTRSDVNSSSCVVPLKPGLCPSFGEDLSSVSAGLLSQNSGCENKEINKTSWQRQKQQQQTLVTKVTQSSLIDKIEPHCEQEQKPLDQKVTTPCDTPSSTLESSESELDSDKTMKKLENQFTPEEIMARCNKLLLAKHLHLTHSVVKANSNNNNNDKIIPTENEKAKFRRSLDSATSMVFHTRTGLPLTSSPAPVRKGNCFDFDSTLTSVSALKSSVSNDVSKFRALFDNPEEQENESINQFLLSTSAPASMTSSSLLGNFEESVLNGRLEPVSTVEGFSAEIGASGSFCPSHITLPVTVFFYTLSDLDKVSTPYLGHVNLGPKGYHVPKSGTVQVTLFNPHGTVVKMFVVMYNLSDMPPNSKTFLRQRTLYMPVNASEDDSEASKWLRYLIHLRFTSSKSGRIYLHTDIRMVIFRKSDIDAATIFGTYELRSFTKGPINPKFSPKR